MPEKEQTGKRRLAIVIGCDEQAMSGLESSEWMDWVMVDATD